MATRWTLDEDVYLIQWEGFEARYMAWDLGRSIAAIYQRKHFLKSHKGNERLACALLRMKEPVT